MMNADYQDERSNEWQSLGFRQAVVVGGDSDSRCFNQVPDEFETMMQGVIVRLSAIVFVLALLNACTSMRWDPARHHVTVESARSGNVEISQVFLRKKGNGVVVYGELSPRHLTQEVPAGRVHVLLVSSDGTSLYEESVPFYRIGKPFKDQQRYSFSAAIPVVPPEGGAVHLQFEGGP